MNEKNYIKKTCEVFKKHLDHINECKNIELFFNYKNEHFGLAQGALFAYGEKEYDIICRMNHAFSELAWKNFI